MVTFITATLWIAVFSYFMVWLVSGGVVGRLNGQPLPSLCQERPGDMSVPPLGKSQIPLTAASFSIERGFIKDVWHHAVCQKLDTTFGTCLQGRYGEGGREMSLS
jgi:hypothetical protein